MKENCRLCGRAVKKRKGCESERRKMLNFPDGFEEGVRK